MEEEKNPKGRRLSLEEKLLWEIAMADVVKNPRGKKQSIPISKTDLTPAKKHGDKALFTEAKSAFPPQKIPNKPLNKTLEKRQAKKIKQGKTTIDAKIDLHGFTEDKAYASLLRMVDSAHQRGKRCILVITGKGKEGRGLLAQRVPQWLNTPPLKEKIINISEALPQHGGSGALYVFLKKH